MLHIFCTYIQMKRVEGWSNEINYMESIAYSSKIVLITAGLTFKGLDS